nr:hypothetical protein CFP56_58986 [Quercus suber]
MELAFLLRGVGAEVVWITNQKSVELDDVVYSLEHKIRILLSGLSLVLQWTAIYGAMIDSLTTAEYWKNRTRECLGFSGRMT